MGAGFFGRLFRLLLEGGGDSISLRFSFHHLLDALGHSWFGFRFFFEDFVLFGFQFFVDSIFAVIFDGLAAFDGGVGAGGLVAREASKSLMMSVGPVEWREA